MTLTINFPMPPNLINGKLAKLHWRVKLRAKDGYWALLDGLQMTKRLPPPPKVPLDRVGLSSAIVNRNLMDDDNAIARHKHLLDWLVTRGYLVDDKRPHVRWLGIPEQRISRKEPASITLTLTPE